MASDILYTTLFFNSKISTFHKLASLFREDDIYSRKKSSFMKKLGS